MANDLIDLGTADLFTLNPNWATIPKTTPQALRRLIGFQGTADTLQSLGNVPALTFDEFFTIYNKTDMKYFLDFINDHKGRWGRFWVRHPKTFFNLKSTAGIGSVIIYVERNEFDWIYQGYERFYFQLANGDIITRQITSVVEDDLNDRIELHFTGGLDRNIYTTTPHIMGRLLLVRFDNDEFSLSIKNQLIAEVSIRVVELIQEYGEV